VLELNFYHCTVIMRQDSTGSPIHFLTFEIAETAQEAIDKARATAQEQLPGDRWAIDDVNVVPFRREVLEEVAEKVLGWKRPQARSH
jgi:hypothetical protein